MTWPRPHELTLLLTMVAAGGSMPRKQIHRRDALIKTCVAHGWLFDRPDGTTVLTLLGRTTCQRYDRDGYTAALAKASVPPAATTVAEAEQIIRDAATSSQLRTFACNYGGRA